MGRVAWSHLPAASGFSSKFKQHFLHVHMSFFSFLNVYGRFSFLLGLSSFVSQTWLTHTVMWHDGEWFLIYCPHHHHHHHDFHCHSAAIVVVTLLPPPSYQLPTLVATVTVVPASPYGTFWIAQSTCKSLPMNVLLSEPAGSALFFTCNCFTAIKCKVHVQE